MRFNNTIQALRYAVRNGFQIERGYRPGLFLAYKDGSRLLIASINAIVSSPNTGAKVWVLA